MLSVVNSMESNWMHYYWSISCILSVFSTEDESVCHQQFYPDSECSTCNYGNQMVIFQTTGYIGMHINTISRVKYLRIPKKKKKKKNRIRKTRYKYMHNRYVFIWNLFKFFKNIKGYYIIFVVWGEKKRLFWWQNLMQNQVSHTERHQL